MAKFYSEITRDIVREIRMGALIAVSPRTGAESVIAPPVIHLLPSKAGTVTVHGSKGKRDAYVAAINSENPGAAIAV